MENAMTYYKYPTFVEKLVANEETARFPQITMCPNALLALSISIPSLNIDHSSVSFLDDFEESADLTLD